MTTISKIRIEIYDDSDCETCTARHDGELEMLAEVKCSMLTDVSCAECGRMVSLFVEAI